jgi:hypothetical protein
MSSSDYLAIKKRRYANPFSTEHVASEKIRNTQYLTIQTTPLINEDGEFIENVERFSISFPPNQDYGILPNYYDTPNKPVFTIPRIRTNEYIKKRYQPPFCWNCYIPVDAENAITQFGCSVCDTVQSLQEPVQNLIQEVTDESLKKAYSLNSK